MHSHELERCFTSKLFRYLVVEPLVDFCLILASGAQEAMKSEAGAGGIIPLHSL